MMEVAGILNGIYFVCLLRDDRMHTVRIALLD